MTKLLGLQDLTLLVSPWHCCQPERYVSVSACYGVTRSCTSINVEVTVDIIQPTLSIPWLTTPICVLIAFNLVMHYYYVCTVAPGFVDDPIREPGRGIMWAKKRTLKGSKALTGVRWTHEEGIKITKALTTKCRKCGQIKPEVSFYFGRELFKADGMDYYCSIF